ncbi:glycoside hydrolase family 16 protein [Cellvibrio japonicus]|uniref:Beta glucanase, putative, glu16B n=1 Tax=Cellvibrio japonicus (strain Ueda107) TaxID=498211 RepID=B3PGG9_CELJU|nr:glycoside hydrolase family 16 protein [Cellvibrio japonicus]ACE84798.1 beta glucanase, putative, glu16B [Cellvibrio japonicus Ueda107]QEI10957.1 glycoside hydrolase family 16 protein [Cellvibrio japonicus]QEI14533.1 glycoside hydrolase family 16 protein [Cellvibrio japonicus]QEI18111.1 glycoside hydrolase family 16 protein [Cellvibrio japonicus]
MKSWARLSLLGCVATILGACHFSGKPSPAPDSTPEAHGWQLVWQDEFEGNQLDTRKWGHEKNCWGGGNNELQCYTDKQDNAFVRDGLLTIVARRETFRGPALNDDMAGYRADDTANERHYTSARLRTKHKGDWRYGRFEIRAKMPQGQGIWPAIWMLPSEWHYGSWPLSGEIDIFEAVNSNTEKFGNEVHGTLHYGELPPRNRYSGTGYTPPQPIWEQFHTYAIEWEEGEIRWYVDDVHFATQTSAGWYTYYQPDSNKPFVPGENAAPFDQKFHLMINLAVGGNWPGSPNAETTFPQQLQVDYVRVYQCTRHSQTGKGCASHVNPAITPLKGFPGSSIKD